MSQEYQTVSVGQELKRIREQRGWSLEAAAKVTRIRADQLALIEQDKLEEFPSQSYVRGFIRIYSKALGLNPDIVMDHVEKRPDKKVVIDEEESLFLDPQPRPRQMDAVVGLDDRAQEWGSKLMAALVALVIIAIIAVVYQTMQGSNSLALSNIGREITRDATLAEEETALPVVPRERLQVQPRQPTQTEDVVVRQAKPVVPTATARPVSDEVETPAINQPQPEALRVVRPPQIFRIAEPQPQIESNTNTSSSAQQIGDSASLTPEQEAVTPPGDMPVRPAVFVNPAGTNEDIIGARIPSPVRIEIQDGRVVTFEDTATSNNQINQDIITPIEIETPTPTLAQGGDPEEFIILDEIPINEEEVTLSDERFAQLQRERAAAQATNPQPAQPVVNGPRVGGSRIPRALPVSPGISSPPANTPIREQDISTPFEQLASEPTSPRITDTQQPPVDTTVAPFVAGDFGEVVNQLRMELSKEAFVRVFVNDIAGNPVLDEVLPAGSAASWEGRTFYVTIRPANAATFIFNGKRYDYSDRGPENVTVRFP